MQIARILAAAFVALAPLGSVGFDSANNRPRGYVSVQEESDWAEHNYQAVLKFLLPSGFIPSDAIPSKVKWIITVRTMPPHGRPEQAFTLAKKYDGGVEATLTIVKGASIKSQLRQLHVTYPEKTSQELANLISIERRTVTQVQCRQLRQRAASAETLSFSPVLPDELRVDETGYEIWSQSLYGNQLTVLLGGPGPGAKVQTHPLLRWAEETIRILSGTCSSSPTN